MSQPSGVASPKPLEWPKKSK